MNILYIPKNKIILAKPKYGLLYNWFAATDPRNISPPGWHLPTYDEFEELNIYLGGTMVSGGKLKEIGYVHWDSPNTGATNETGFNGFGTGGRDYNTGEFLNINKKCFFITATSNGTTGYKSKTLMNTAAILYWGSNSINHGDVIRLVKDTTNDTGAMVDNNGLIYPTVKIGNQVWLAANLKSTKYRNGDTVPEVTNAAAWTSLTTGALCAYNNDWNNV